MASRQTQSLLQMNQCIVAGVISLLLLTNCSNPPSSYQQDVALLSSRTPVIELVGKDPSARLLFTPNLQGRIMTST